MVSQIPAVLPDTNYLLEYPDLLNENWLISPIEILISETVLSELHGLTQNPDPNRAQKAQKALSEIEKYIGQFANLIEIESPIITITSRFKEVKPPLEAYKPDHQIIAQARNLLTAKIPRFCAVLSNDKELSDIAEAMTVIVINRQNEIRFHQELKRKFEWWDKYHNAGNKESSHKIISKSPQKQSAQSHQQALLIKSAKGWLRRANAYGKLSTLYLAPSQARVAFTDQVIQNVLKSKNQCVLIVAESNQIVQNWAAELRSVGQSNSPHSLIWDDGIEATFPPVVQICTYHQAEIHFLRFINRLHKDKKRLSIIVDGCEMLDPALSALFLFHCDKFYGLIHDPINPQNAPSYRIMNLLFPNNHLISTTFADAERDGWGHSSNLSLSKVEFTPDELIYWNELNGSFTKQRQQAIIRHPHLTQCADFWAGLTDLLSKTVDPEDVELIKLREQREQMAQLSQNKAQLVLEKLNNRASKTHRTLIFDIDSLWTPVLTRLLQSNNINVAELATQVDIQKTWDHFSGSRLDALIVSNIPSEILPAIHLHQIIILTPLCSLTDILNQINWALSHTLIKTPLQIDLLYSKDTPEELAMFEVAEATHGIHTK